MKHDGRVSAGVLKDHGSVRHHENDREIDFDLDHDVHERNYGHDHEQIRHTCQQATGDDPDWERAWDNSL